jgi:hypothetical protein
MKYVNGKFVSMKGAKMTSLSHMIVILQFYEQQSSALLIESNYKISNSHTTNVGWVPPLRKEELPGPV